MLTQIILDHIVENYLGSDGEQFTVDTPLLELNIIDSASLFDLVEMLHREAGVVIPLQEVTPKNFASVREMMSLVGRLQGRQSDGSPVSATGSLS
jgi:acyl carrier protein